MVPPVLFVLKIVMLFPQLESRLRNLEDIESAKKRRIERVYDKDWKKGAGTLITAAKAN